MLFLLTLIFGVIILNYGCDATEGSFEDSVQSIYSLTTNVLPEESGTIHPSEGDYAVEVGIEIEARPSEGYLFDYWEGDLMGDSNPEIIIFRSDISITAYFIPKEYTLTITIDGNGTVRESLVNQTDDNSTETKIQLTAEAADGWYFDRWEGDLSGSDNPKIITVDKEKSITAIFVQNTVDQYSLSIKTKGKGAVSIEPEKPVYDEADQVTLTATPASGWSFRQWQGDLSGTTSPATLTIDKNKSVTAIFEEVPAEQFTLSVQSTGQGSVSKNPDQDTYTDGTQVTLTATPASGWSFRQWQGDLSGTTSPATLTIDKNKSVTVVFEEDAVATLTVDEVKFFIEEMELGGARRTDDFETNNFILNLPLDGTRFMITHVGIPAGYYDELELDITKPKSSVKVDDPDFRDGSRSYSLVVRGTYNGTNYIFRSYSDFKIDVDINPHLEIKPGQNTVIAIALDFNSWFKDIDNSNMNPNDTSNTKQIIENIKMSLSEFEDNF